MPLLKRIFGQGKSKASNTLVALCIGDYNRITLPIIGHEAHQLEALLAHEVAADAVSPSTSQPVQPSSKSSATGPPQSSFKAFRHLLQHFGAGASSSPQDGCEAESQQQLEQFLKQLAGYSSVSFVNAADDGLVSRDKVLAKLTKLFKQSTASVVIVSYCGPSDERGNWRLANQMPGASSGSGVSPGGGGGGGGVVSFREVSMLWQRHRKHSQRLVLLLDCANSGYWVSALRMLSKAEQLELSLGVQASDCSLPATHNLQLTYQPGIFLQFYLSNNKWRREPRRPPQQPQPQAQPGAPLQQQAHSGSLGGGSVHRGEQWLPGMLPSYYATWLNDNLVDYGLALRFFNSQVPRPSVAGIQPHDSAVAGANAPADSRAALFPDSPMNGGDGGAQGWRCGGVLLTATESAKSLNRPSQLGDEVTSPSSDPWTSQRSTIGLRSPLEPEALETSADRAAVRAAMAMRAASVPDAARRRFSTLADYYNPTTDGTGLSSQVTASPATPNLQRVRMSTPQAEWRQGMSPIDSFAHRSPTLPGDDILSIGGSTGTLANGTSMVDAVSPSGSMYVHTYAGGVGLPGTASIPRTASGSKHPSVSVPAGKSGGKAFTAAAVHPLNVDVDDDSYGSPGGVGGGADEQLDVQHSARSDTVALAWDRRSTNAERCLLVDERGGGGAASFTGPTSRRGGFANELYGALHEVATERRLWARRAPLEGDESMDTLMEDADLERRASNASLPSAMLPRDVARATAGAESIMTTQILGTSSVVPSGVEGRDGGSPVAVLGLPSPRQSLLGSTSHGHAVDRQSNVAPRQASRLFLVSMGGPHLEQDLSAAQLSELAEQNDDSISELSLTTSMNQHAEATRRQQSNAGRGGGADSGGGSSRPGERTGSGSGEDRVSGGTDCLLDVALSMLMKPTTTEAASARAAAPASVEFLQPSHSPSPSPAVSGVHPGQDRRRGRTSAAGPPSHLQSIPSGSILRNLLKQQVSIADSMDLDSAVLGTQPGAQRRPGRFEMAGSESSSFVFGDDRERFEMLRLLREHQAEGGVAAGAGGAGGAGYDAGVGTNGGRARGVGADGVAETEVVGDSVEEGGYNGDLLLTLEVSGTLPVPTGLSGAVPLSMNDGQSLNVQHQQPYKAGLGGGSSGGSLFTAVAAAAAKVTGAGGRESWGHVAKEHDACELPLGDDDPGLVLVEGDVCLEV